jgi:hypothetical protein
VVFQATAYQTWRYYYEKQTGVLLFWNETSRGDLNQEFVLLEAHFKGIIIPELASFLMLPLLIIAALQAVIICRRRHFYPT